DGGSGGLIGWHRMGAAYRSRFGAPYVGIHRADLQAILSEAVGLDHIRLGKRLVDIEDARSRVTLRFDDGSSAEADLVVGADGARSFVRRWMLRYDDALYSGCSGFRGVVPIDRLRALHGPTDQRSLGPVSPSTAGTLDEGARDAARGRRPCGRAAPRAGRQPVDRGCGRARPMPG